MNIDKPTSSQRGAEPETPDLAEAWAKGSSTVASAVLVLASWMAQVAAIVGFFTASDADAAVWGLGARVVAYWASIGVSLVMVAWDCAALAAGPVAFGSGAGDEPRWYKSSGWKTMPVASPLCVVVLAFAALYSLVSGDYGRCLPSGLLALSALLRLPRLFHVVVKAHSCYARYFDSFREKAEA